MAITTLSSQEFNQDPSRATTAAQEGPVFITDRGRPAYVLITVDEYQRLMGKSHPPQTLGDLLALPVADDIDFDPLLLQGPLSRPADLS